MAGYVMPLDAIAVEVVENCDASLIVAVLSLLPIVGLSTTTAASVGPVPTPLSPLLVGGSDAGIGPRPEPSVNNRRLEIGAVTTVEVTLPTRGPYVLDGAIAHSFSYEVTFELSFQAHKVLAMLPANVSSVKPVSLVGFGGFMDPRKEIEFSVSEERRMLLP